MIKIDQAFNPEAKSVYDFFVNSGVGLYIPLYQRDYSWDIDNVNQLLDDISKGVENSLENDNDEIRFLGTIITVTERDKRTVEPQDPQGLPDYIEKIIDGQQRISTITLLATELYFAITELESKFSNHPIQHEQVREVVKYWQKKLIAVFSLDLGRGEPTRKPKIIRGNVDTWTKSGELNNFYKSSLSNYLAKSILNIENKSSSSPELERTDEKDKVYANIKRFRSWIRSTVISAHINSSDDFPTAWEIISKINQQYIWSFERADLVSEINKRDLDNTRTLSYKLCSLVQLLAACHYLLDRCCFTIIKPKNDDWAFDMFQSLNATGTPLTAIEVFQPLVVNVTNQKEDSYKKSSAQKSFVQIEELFKDAKTAAQKSQRSNDLLTSLRIAVDGNKLESHFSKQRKWLSEVYESKCKSYEEQKAFTTFFGNYAQFYKDIWKDYDGRNGMVPSLTGSNDAEIASLLILLLKDSNHKMAITVLGFFYDQVLRGGDRSITNFVQGVKAIAAFYILWRSAKDNAGLDNTYRDFFKGKEGQTKSNKWLANKSLDVEEVKDYFSRVLESETIFEKEQWLEKASKNLKYNKSKSVSKFALFVSSHDTIVDEDNIGLMKKGTKNCNPMYLKIESWISDDFKTLEHIAPITDSRNLWDLAIYSDEETVQLVGNLTLLPSKVNISASNKGWKEKILYYKHLAEKDTTRKTELSTKAYLEGITLSSETINLLQAANFSSHVSPIIKVDETSKWDKDLIERRSRRICELLYDYVIVWLR